MFYKRPKFKSGLISTLPNILGLHKARDILFKSKFEQNSDIFTRKVQLQDPESKIASLEQTITAKEELDLTEVQQRIQANNLNGYIFPTNFLHQVLAQHPLPLSAQKQALIEQVAKMNNGKLNEAEGINYVFQSKNGLPTLSSSKTFTKLAPNFCSQLISNLHYNKKSRLTIGESHLFEPTKKIPYGSALLQISHLTHHALDLNLSVGLSPENTFKPINAPEKVCLHEHCFSIPYSLKNEDLSAHGYILYLKGSNITPKLIKELIGLKYGFGGVTIATGQASGQILNYKSRKKIFKKEQTSLYSQQSNTTLHESIGSYLYEPNFLETSAGLLTADQLGNLTSLDGEIVIIFYSYLQTFTAEYL